MRRKTAVLVKCCQAVDNSPTSPRKTYGGVLWIKGHHHADHMVRGRLPEVRDCLYEASSPRKLLNERGSFSEF